MIAVGWLAILGLPVFAALTPAQAAVDKAAWTVVMARFAGALPQPLPGWTATKTTAQVIHSAFQKEI